MDTPDPVKLRGEHLVNLYRYMHEPDYRLVFGEDQGYDATFAKRHDEILQSVLDDPAQVVVVVTGLDAICTTAACPKRGPQCETSELLAKDERVAREFGVIIGREYAAGELVELLSGLLAGKGVADWQ